MYSTHVKSAQIIKELKKAGWTCVRQKGSHRQFQHPSRPGTVTVPHPKSDMGVGTIKSIEKQSGIKLR